MRLFWMIVLAFVLGATGCVSGRRGHGGGGGGGGGDGRDEGPVGGDDGANTSDGTGDADPCAGYDPLPEVVVTRVEGTYSIDGMDTSEVIGDVVMTLTPTEFEYAIDATVEIRDPERGTVVSCEDGVGNGACFGSLSVSLCEGDAFFSYDVPSATGSWSYYDSATSAFGSGTVYGTD